MGDRGDSPRLPSTTSTTDNKLPERPNDNLPLRRRDVGGQPAGGTRQVLVRDPIGRSTTDATRQYRQSKRLFETKDEQVKPS